MARGEKVVTFDFNFTYSEKGSYVEANSITLKAPGLAKFDTHARMKGWVGKAVLAFSANAKPAAGGQSDDEPARKDDDDDQDVMQIMSMGLGVDDFATFAAYVKKTLTNSTLATVGDRGVLLTDEVWMDLEKHGGMEAVMKVMSDFTGFFFEALTSRKKSGAAPVPSSVSPTKAASASKPRALSRLPE